MAQVPERIKRVVTLQLAANGETAPLLPPEQAWPDLLRGTVTRTQLSLKRPTVDGKARALYRGDSRPLKLSVALERAGVHRGLSLESVAELLELNPELYNDRGALYLTVAAVTDRWLDSHGALVGWDGESNVRLIPDVLAEMFADRAAKSMKSRARSVKARYLVRMPHERRQAIQLALFDLFDAKADRAA